MKVVIELAPLYVQSSGERLGSAILRKFQKELADIGDGAIVLSAPTGSGKTITLLTDSERGAAMGLYPNNELLCNQITGLDSFIQKYLGMKATQSSLTDFCKSPENLDVNYIPLNKYEAREPIDMFGRKVRRIYVAGMSGKIIKASGDRGRLETLLKVSEHLEKAKSDKSDDYYIVGLGTPDTFFLLSLYLYQNFEELGQLLSLLRALPSDMPIDEINKILLKSGFDREKLTRITEAFLPFRRSTLFVDEYHLYGFYELSSFKALAYVLKHIHDWEGRIVFSSATPRREFVDEIVEELGLSVHEVNAISQVKERGEEHELVRGPMNLVFYGINTREGNPIAKLYRSSELAYELLDTKEFKEFIELYNRDRGARGIAILEKVSHAELFAEELFSKYRISPICLYSMPRSDICHQPSGNGFIVGTGAKIGQGVEYEGTIFGVVARVVASDLLQSISRIGRRLSSEATVLIPLDADILKRRKGILREEGKGKVTYEKLADWVEREAEPFQKAIPRGDEKNYKNLIKTREKMLKAMSLILYYRLTGAHLGDAKMYEEAMRAYRDLVILSPPDTLHNLLLFRDTGPTITFARDVNGKLECHENDLGTIIRNYEIRAPRDGEVCGNDANRRPAIIIASRKDKRRSEIVVKCKKGADLKTFVMGYYGDKLLVEWNTLREVFKCGCESSDGRELKRLNEELEGQLFLVPRYLDSDFANYIYRTGRGLMVKMDNTALALVYV